MQRLRTVTLEHDRRDTPDWPLGRSFTGPNLTPEQRSERPVERPLPVGQRTNLTTMPVFSAIRKGTPKSALHVSTFT
jgi:hypothetical protein